MTASQVSSYSLVVYVFFKIPQLFFWLRDRFSDELRNLNCASQLSQGVL